MGQNQQDRLQNAFSLNLILTTAISLVFVAFYLFAALFDLTGFLTRDPVVRPIFNRYLLGQAVGVLPQLLGSQLAAFLSMENRGKRTFIASLVYIFVNLTLNYLFVKLLRMEAFGLAIASSLGMWVFFAVQAQHYLSGSSHLRLKLGGLDWKESLSIVKIGVPGAVNNGYQTLRGLAVNWLLTAFVGSVGISAFAAANNLLAIVWSIPVGMQAVSRMMLSVSMGEEDRQTLTDVMRVMFRRFLPLMCLVSVLIILCAEPLTRIFYRDPAEPVYMMTVWGIRILPLCMPLAVIIMHFVGRPMLMSPAYYEEVFGTPCEVNMFFVRLGGADETSLTAALRSVPGFTGVIRSDESKAVFDSSTSVINSLVVLFIFMGAVMAGVVLMNLTNMYVLQKKRDLTIMRVNGFTTRETVRYLLRETYVTTVLGLLLGLGIGSGIGYIILRSLEQPFAQFVRSLSMPAWIVGAGLTVLFTVIVNLIALRPVKKLRLTDVV